MANPDIEGKVTKIVAFAAGKLMGNTAYTDTGNAPTGDCRGRVYYIPIAKLFHC